MPELAPSAPAPRHAGVVSHCHNSGSSGEYSGGADGSGASSPPAAASDGSGASSPFSGVYSGGVGGVGRDDGVMGSWPDGSTASGKCSLTATDSPQLLGSTDGEEQCYAIVLHRGLTACLC
jgi:hypothetical protein